MSVGNTHMGAVRIGELLNNCKSIFFLGIGGINMSSLAHITKERGFRTGGSDRACSAICKRLEKEGINIFYSHSEGNVDGYDALVYTVAVAEDNPELNEARRRGIPCISRADYMGFLMSGYKKRIGVSGMHGKSTCTSMCASALIAADKDPTVLSGAELCAMGGAYRIGSEDVFLFEACEYMDSFLDFTPNISVILNVEMDHVDYFESMEHIYRSFARFADISLSSGGACIANADDPNVRQALSLAEARGEQVILFGKESEDARLRAVNITEEAGRSSFDIADGGVFLCHVRLSVPGEHNILNALAAAAVLLLCGADGQEIKKGLEGFGGAARRSEYKGQVNGADIYDDYGHHPTEVKSTLEGMKKLCRGRLFCLFQSHTYSRTAALLDGFVQALAVADRVFVADIYAARETDKMGMSPELIAERINGIGGSADAVHGFAEGAERLKSELSSGDVAVIMGAGDVFKVFPYLL